MFTHYIVVLDGYKCVKPEEGKPVVNLASKLGLLMRT